jgi:hypothetical protein
MKSLSLRSLLREPRKVKRMTRAGIAVQITDNGRPLWILQPAAGAEANKRQRRQALSAIFDEVMHEKRSKVSAARLLEESRR